MASERNESALPPRSLGCSQRLRDSFLDRRRGRTFRQTGKKTIARSAVRGCIGGSIWKSLFAGRRVAVRWLMGPACSAGPTRRLPRVSGVGPTLFFDRARSGGIQTTLSRRAASTFETRDLFAIRCIYKVNSVFALRSTRPAGSVEELDATGDQIIVGVSPSCLSS